jgi:hypothetical protein
MQISYLKQLKCLLLDVVEETSDKESTEAKWKRASFVLTTFTANYRKEGISEHITIYADEWNNVGRI